MLAKLLLPLLAAPLLVAAQDDSDNANYTTTVLGKLAP